MDTAQKSAADVPSSSEVMSKVPASNHATHGASGILLGSLHVYGVKQLIASMCYRQLNQNHNA